MAPWDWERRGSCLSKTWVEEKMGPHMKVDVWYASDDGVVGRAASKTAVTREAAKYPDGTLQLVGAVLAWSVYPEDCRHLGHGD